MLWSWGRGGELSGVSMHNTRTKYSQNTKIKHKNTKYINFTFYPTGMVFWLTSHTRAKGGISYHPLVKEGQSCGVLHGSPAPAHLWIHILPGMTAHVSTHSNTSSDHDTAAKPVVYLCWGFPKSHGNPRQVRVSCTSESPPFR